MLLGLMPRLVFSVTLISALLAATLQTDARGHGGGHSRSYAPRVRAYHPRQSHTYTPRTYTPRTYTIQSNVPRSYRPRDHRESAWLSKYSSNPYTAQGSREHRSFSEKQLFWAQTGHPHGWPGHVVDHIKPLACGGADIPSNMQWQTIAEAKAKDKWERNGCKHH